MTPEEAFEFLAPSADKAEVRRMLGRFYHLKGMYEFHDITKADKEHAKKVRCAADHLLDLIYGGKLSTIKIKMSPPFRIVTKEALTDLRDYALGIEEERLPVRGNRDRSDRKLAIYFADQLLKSFPPASTVKQSDIAYLAAAMNGEAKEEANYRPLVSVAKKQGEL